jgi:hypothetical protein
VHGLRMSTRCVLEPFPYPPFKASRLGIALYPDTDFDVRRKTTVEVEVVAASSDGGADPLELIALSHLVTLIPQSCHQNM